MTTDHRNSHVLPKIWVAEFNGGVRIWIGIAQIAVFALVFYININRQDAYLDSVLVP